MPRAVERVTLPLERLVPSPYNPRKMSDEAKAGLRTSIERFGMVQEIVVNRRNMHVVGGHQRLVALQETGAKEGPVALVELTDDEEKALNVTLNNPKVQGEWTSDLAAVLDSVADDVLKGLRADDLVEELQAKLEAEEKRAQRQFAVEQVHVAPPPQMVWALVAIPAEHLAKIAPHLEAISKVDGVMYDQIIR